MAAIRLTLAYGRHLVSASFQKIGHGFDRYRRACPTSLKEARSERPLDYGLQGSFAQERLLHAGSLP